MVIRESELRSTLVCLVVFFLFFFVVVVVFVCLCVCLFVFVQGFKDDCSFSRLRTSGIIFRELTRKDHDAFVLF